MNQRTTLLVDDEPMFSLDDDDIIDTSVDGEAWPTSYVGVLPREEETFEEAARSRHRALADAIFELEKTCESFDSVDPSARAAELSLRRRVGALALLSRTLGDVSAFAESHEHGALFSPRGELAPLLASVYLWVGEITEALREVARELNVLQPSWATFRERLCDVAWVHRSAITEQARFAERGIAVPDELRDALADLAVILVGFKRALDEPFG
jgi:hypothetical protein